MNFSNNAFLQFSEFDMNLENDQGKATFSQYLHFKRSSKSHPRTESVFSSSQNASHASNNPLSFSLNQGTQSPTNSPLRTNQDTVVTTTE